MSFRVLLFQRFQKSDHITNLPRIEPELRHRRMARRDALGQRFGEVLDRILVVQRAERRCRAKRTRTYLVDCMALGAVRGDERQPSLNIWL